MALFEELQGVFTLLTMIAALVLVLGLAYFTTRLLGGRVQLRSGQRNVKVLERTPVDQHASLLLVEVAGKVYLLGVTPQNITNLAQVEGELLPPPGATGGAEALFPGGGAFAGILKSKLSGRPSGADEENHKESTHEG